MLQAHFGDGVHVCPAAGLNAPELAAGWLFELVDAIWQMVEEDILGDDDFPLTPEETERLLADVQRAKACMVALLRLKLNFWSCLPWMMFDNVAAHPKISVGPMVHFP